MQLTLYLRVTIDYSLVEEAFANLISDLVEIARSDNRISEDEQALIDFIRDQVDEYKHVLADTLEKDPEEFNKWMNRAVNRLIHDSISVAKRDNVINDEEISLLKCLIEFGDNYD